MKKLINTEKLKTAIASIFIMVMLAGGLFSNQLALDPDVSISSTDNHASFESVSRFWHPPNSSENTVRLTGHFSLPLSKLQSSDLLSGIVRASETKDFNVSAYTYFSDHLLDSDDHTILIFPFHYFL